MHRTERFVRWLECSTRPRLQHVLKRLVHLGRRDSRQLWGRHILSHGLTMLFVHLLRNLLNPISLESFRQSPFPFLICRRRVETHIPRRICRSLVNLVFLCIWIIWRPVRWLITVVITATVRMFAFLTRLTDTGNGVTAPLHVLCWQCVFNCLHRRAVSRLYSANSWAVQGTSGSFPSF